MWSSFIIKKKWVLALSTAVHHKRISQESLVLTDWDS